MTKHAAFFLVLGTITLACGPSSGQSVSHVCPQFPWGSTENIVHYYSEYVFSTNGMLDCSLSEWDNFDGDASTPTGGSCSAGAAGCVPNKEKPVLAKLPEPNYEPELDYRVVEVLKQCVVDVRLSPQKTIKAKLYLLLIDPRRNGGTQSPIVVAHGFEIRYDPNYPAFATVPTPHVKRVRPNLYKVALGRGLAFNLHTHDEK